jgi:hypothetical protein
MCFPSVVRTMIPQELALPYRYRDIGRNGRLEIRRSRNKR